MGLEGFQCQGPIGEMLVKYYLFIIWFENEGKATFKNEIINAYDFGFVEK